MNAPDAALAREPLTSAVETARRGVSILLMTPYTGGNLGDAAIQDAVVHHLRCRLAEPRISLVTLDPRTTSKRHGLPSFPLEGAGWSENFCDSQPVAASPDSMPNGTAARQPAQTAARRPAWLRPVLSPAGRLARRGASFFRRARREFRHGREAYRLLKQTDLLVMSGGGQIDEYWGGPFGHPFALFKWTLLARWANTPVVFPSVGVCSLKTRAGRFFAYQALRLAAFRSYRDSGSKELLQPMAFARNDPVCPDLAFSHPRAAQRAPNSVSAGNGRIVGISPIIYLSSHGWPTQDLPVYERYLQVLGDFTARVLQAGNRVVLFTTSWMDRFAVDDLRGRLQAMRESDGWAGRLRLVQQEDLNSQLAEMEQMDLVVASRLHGIILAHLLGKPALAISYDRKVHAHMDSMGQERFCLKIEDCTPQELWDGIDRLATEAAAVSTAVLAKVEAFRRALDQQYDLISRLPARRRQPVPA